MTLDGVAVEEDLQRVRGRDSNITRLRHHGSRRERRLQRRLESLEEDIQWMKEQLLELKRYVSKHQTSEYSFVVVVVVVCLFFVGWLVGWLLCWWGGGSLSLLLLFVCWLVDCFVLLFCWGGGDSFVVVVICLLVFVLFGGVLFFVFNLLVWQTGPRSAFSCFRFSSLSSLAANKGVN